MMRTFSVIARLSLPGHRRDVEQRAAEHRFVGNGGGFAQGFGFQKQIERIAGQSKRHDAAPEGHPAVEGDLVVMDYKGTVNGVAFAMDRMDPLFRLRQGARYRLLMRNATAYGASTRLRLDIVVNNLTAIALTTGKARLESDGTPWRPLVHIEDISRAFLAMLEAPRELVHKEAFNVGRPEDNVQIRAIAEMVRDAVPGSEVTLADGAGPDLRNYRVDFSKLAETFPGLRLRWTVRDGITELADAYAKYGLTYDDFQSSRFVRLRRIRELQAAGLVDEMLRRTSEGLPSVGAHAVQENNS